MRIALALAILSAPFFVGQSFRCTMNSEFDYSLQVYVYIYIYILEGLTVNLIVNSIYQLFHGI